jgi:hypothetical protein
MAFSDNSPNTTDPEKKTGFTFRGKEIVLSKTGGRPFSGLVKKGMEKGIYPEEKRIEAVTVYAATGHFGRTSELTKVPEGTIRAWRKQEWFLELLREVRAENNDKIDSKFTEIVERSLDQLVDRVEHGDYHVLRDGSLIRKPVNAKDLSLVAAINVDKRQLLRGEPTSRSESVGSADEKAVGRLEKLAETFENLAKFGRQPKTIEQIEDARLIEDVPGGQSDTATPEGHSEGQISQGEG